MKSLNVRAAFSVPSFFGSKHNVFIFSTVTSHLLLSNLWMSRINSRFNNLKVIRTEINTISFTCRLGVFVKKLTRDSFSLIFLLFSSKVGGFWKPGTPCIRPCSLAGSIRHKLYKDNYESLNVGITFPLYCLPLLSLRSRNPAC